jgi:uncharacterized membrane protein YqaE (UPF0057 family)
MSKFILYVLAILFPPLPVYMLEGTSKVFWTNLFLCCIIWFPGILHGLYVVSKSEEQ